MIVLNCKGCGKPHSAEIGDSIHCDCGRIITVTRPSDSTLSRQPPPIVEHVPPQPKSPWVPARPLKSSRFAARRWILPVLGIVMLAVGITLTVINYRSRTNSDIVVQTASSPTPLSAVTPNAPLAHANSIAPKTSPTPQTQRTNNANDASQITEESPYEPLLRGNNAASNETTPEPSPEPRTIRYPTGTNLTRPLSANGRGTLHISNRTGFDAIARLVDEQTNLTVRQVYIQNNTDNDIASISSGDYLVKFALGSGYNPDTGRFLYSESFMKFDNSFDFREYRTYDGVEWSDHTITLHRVIGGNAHASRISAAEFYR